MKRVMYLLCALLTASTVAAIIGWSIAVGAVILPVIAIPLGIIVILACRQEVNEVMSDERGNQIRSEAALRTLEVLFIAGVITTIVLSAYVVSTPLVPKVTGKFIINADGTRSLSLIFYKDGGTGTPENIGQSITIKNVDSMNETEAMEYSNFWQEGMRQYNDDNLAAKIILGSLIAVVVLYAGFYFYYNRKY